LGAGMAIRLAFPFAASIAVAGIPISPADAAVTINIDQVGGRVIATATGTLDLTGLTAEAPFNNDLFIRPSVGYIGLGIALTVTGYSGMTGPSQFGLGGITPSFQSAGTPFAINGSSFGSPYVFVPVSYISGTPIGAQAIFLGSFASLGLTPGQYVYSSAHDTVTININSVPEPAAWAMMLLGFGGIGFAMRRRRRPEAATAW
jgi:hypothetical protein